MDISTGMGGVQRAKCGGERSRRRLKQNMDNVIGETVADLLCWNYVSDRQLDHVYVHSSGI